MSRSRTSTREAETHKPHQIPSSFCSCSFCPATAYSCFKWYHERDFLIFLLSSLLSLILPKNLLVSAFGLSSARFHKQLFNHSICATESRSFILFLLSSFFYFYLVTRLKQKKMCFMRREKEKKKKKKKKKKEPRGDGELRKKGGWGSGSVRIRAAWVIIIRPRQEPSKGMKRKWLKWCFLFLFWLFFKAPQWVGA